jgi:uncharacterized protein (TIGR03435 family)
MQTLTKKQMTLVRGRSLRGAIIAFALLSVTAWAQQAPVTPTFEAASVKYNSETPGRGDIQRDPGRVTYRNIRLLQLIMLAYHLDASQIEGPSWLGAERYDVVAKIPESVSPSQVPIMLQALLAERFGLKVHREAQVRPVYALVVAPGGPKMTPAATAPPPANIPEGTIRRTVTISSSGPMILRNTTIEGLIHAFSHRLDRPIIDRTGIEGAFDITLDLRLNPGTAPPRSSPDEASPGGNEPEAAVVSAALRDLGLRLESQKASVDILIVDAVRKIPTEN